MTDVNVPPKLPSEQDRLAEVRRQLGGSALDADELTALRQAATELERLAGR
jgi:hypothetical protein